MMRSRVALITILFLLTFSIKAQFNKEDFYLSGHIQNLNTVWVTDIDQEWMTMSSVYNRLNLKWYPHQTLTLTVNARNIFNFGQMVYDFNQIDEFYNKLVTTDGGWADLTKPIFKNDSYILYSNIDRLNLNFSKGNFDITLGRQRINWGINMIWNSNDIFNTFSYFDFDYVERPGCDALRLQYYTSASSSAEVAVKVDANENITAGGLYRFNKWDYDFQVIAGKMVDDLVLGGGWSGNIFDFGFTGEATYFHDQKNFSDTSGIYLISLGLNYMFDNSLFTNAGFLYNSNGVTGDAAWGTSPFELNNLSPKTLSNGRMEVFAQCSYPISPIIQADISGIINPYDGSLFIGPGVTFSVSDNMTFLLMSQIFEGRAGTEYGDFGAMFFTRLKWSF